MRTIIGVAVLGKTKRDFDSVTKPFAYYSYHHLFLNVMMEA